jgi:hypothetical protein
MHARATTRTPKMCRRACVTADRGEKRAESAAVVVDAVTAGTKAQQAKRGGVR